jgi:flagellar hook-length control protein FliK
VRQQSSTQTARAATSALEQRVVTDQAAAANVALGQQDPGDEDLIDEAASAAFDEAQAIRDGDGSTKPVDVAGKTIVTPSVAEIVSAPAPVAAPAASAMDALGEPTASDSMMEEFMMAQRAAAGGDRVGDSDAVIRLAQSAAGALEVKVKREGKDLSLRVRADDMALRQVMLDTLPELKQELQKANLVQGHIEVAEEGIDDQMQSDHTWNDEHSTRGDNRGESMDDPKRAPASTETSKATGPARHDGQLHVVA